MTTPKQIAANQANAQKSTGPITAEGKFRSSQNALKHGIFSEKRKRKPKAFATSDALEFAGAVPNPPESQKLKNDETNPTGSASILLASHTTQNQHAQDAASFTDPQPSNSQNSPNPIEPGDLSQ